MIDFLFFSSFKDIKNLPSTGLVAFIMYMILSIFHRPYHDHNGVTCVHPNAYALFVASQTYVSGYNWDFVVHIVFKKIM